MATTSKMNNDKYVYAGMGVLLMGALIGAGYFGYSWYKKGKEEAAYKDLSESFEGYTKAIGEGTPQKLADVQQALTVGTELHSSSSLYPYFLALQADILTQQGKHEDALQMMDKATALMGKNNPLYYAYAVKDALMSIDSSDSARVKKGRELLEELAKDMTNPLQDMARYYSALDARSKGERDVAQKRLQEIIARGDEASIWHQKALNSMR